MTATTPTVLITGGTGFAGSHLVEHLLELGFTNIHVTQYSDKPGHLANLLPADHFHQLNLTDQAATLELLERLKPDHIYHLASLAAVGSSFENTKQVLDNNIQLQLNLLAAVKDVVSAAKVLIVGSAMEYDFFQTSEGVATETTPLGPVSPYAVSKVMQDLLGYSYFRSYGLNIIRVRPFNHLGERQSPDFVVSAFAKQIAAIEKQQQEKLMVGNLEAVRDFTDVKDIVKAYALLMDQGQVGEVYNLGSGRGYSIQEVLELLIEQSTVPITIEKDPERMRPADIPATIADISKISQLGWQPAIPLAETLTRVLAYWREQL